jgi:hypothetical protein
MVSLFYGRARTGRRHRDPSAPGLDLRRDAPLAVDVGALVVQIAILHGDWIHAIVIGTVINLQRDRLATAGR